MPRLVRFDAPGAIHHVFAQGVGPSAIFRDAGDYDAFVAVARRTFVKLGWQCLIHCLMTTHYHLVVRTRAGDLSFGMQRINGDYARTFNRTHGRRGHPLDAGCLPHEWPYGSFGDAIAGRGDSLSDNAALLELCGGAAKLRAFVEDGIASRERAA